MQDGRVQPGGDIALQDGGEGREVQRQVGGNTPRIGIPPNRSAIDGGKMPPVLPPPPTGHAQG